MSEALRLELNQNYSPYDKTSKLPHNSYKKKTNYTFQNETKIIGKAQILYTSCGFHRKDTSESKLVVL